MCDCKDNAPNKEAIYISAYTIIKKMLSDGVINERVFMRLNEKIASRHNCPSFSHYPKMPRFRHST